MSTMKRALPLLTSLAFAVFGNFTILPAVARDHIDKDLREKVEALRTESEYLRERADELRARGEYEEEKRVRNKASELKYKATALEYRGEDGDDLEDE